MFTRTIRSQMLVGKSGVRWDRSSPETRIPETLGKKIVDLSRQDQFKWKPDEFLKARMEMLKKASDAELNKLLRSAQAGRTGDDRYNKQLITDITKILNDRHQFTEEDEVAVDESTTIQAPANAPAVVAVKEAARENSDTTLQAIETSLAYKENAPVNIEWNDKNEMKSDSVIALLSDLDGMSGVERANRGMLRRIFFGGGDQKEVVGEQQLAALLQWKSQSELNTIFNRITGWNDGIVISSSSLKNDISQPKSRFDFDHATQSKITAFQTHLIEQVEAVSILSSALLGDAEARTGLRTVLEWKTDTLTQALSDPTRVEWFKKMLEANGALKRDPRFLEKLASALVRIGIAPAFRILSGSVLGGYIEQGSLAIEKSQVSRDGMNLTAKAWIGESGSVWWSLDIAAVRLEANWNDPEKRIANRVAYVVEGDANYASRVDALIQKVNEQNQVDASEGSEKEQLKRIAIKGLSDEYKKASTAITESTLSEELKKDALARNTLVYLAHVEKAQGMRLKGIFASATLAGIIGGISATSVDTAATSEGWKIGAGSIEAQTLGGKELNEREVNSYLNTLGITLDGDTYMRDGKEIIVIPSGKKVQWQFETIYTDQEKIVRAIPQLIDTIQQPKNTQVTIKRENAALENDYIQKNSKPVSDLMHRLRQLDPRTSTLETFIALNNYKEAERIFTEMFGGSKDKTWKALLASYNTLSSEKQKSDFFDLLLSKTSGGRISRALWDKIESNKDVTKEAQAYYSRIAEVFARQYGITKDQVMQIFNAISKAWLKNDTIKNLWELLPGGFTGMVAFNQKNGKNSFVQLDTIINANARTIGGLSEIIDSGIQKSIRTKLATKVTQQEIKAVRDASTIPSSVSDDQIQNAIVGGKVHAYLSFEPNAQCFNLWFVAEPTSITYTTSSGEQKVVSTESVGTTVWKTQTQILSVGVGVGIGYGDNEHPSAPPSSTRPGIGDGSNAPVVTAPKF